MNIHTQAVLLSTITLLCFGIGTALSKKYIAVFGPTGYTVARNIFVVSFTFFSLLLFRHTITINFWYIFLGIIISAISFYGLFFFNKAVAVGKIGIVSPIVGTRGLVASVIGIFFLHDVITPLQFYFLLLVIFGVVLSTIELGDIKHSSLFDKRSGIPDTFLAVIFWGVTFPLFSVPSAVLGGFFFTFILETVVLIQAYLHNKVSTKPFSINSKIFRENFIGMSFIGITGGIGSIAMNLAYATGKISLVSAITSGVPLIALLYGKFFYRETLTAKQYIAAFFMIIGIIGLSYFQNGS